MVIKPIQAQCLPKLMSSKNRVQKIKCQNKKEKMLHQVVL